MVTHRVACPAHWLNGLVANAKLGFGLYFQYCVEFMCSGYTQSCEELAEKLDLCPDLRGVSSAVKDQCFSTSDLNLRTNTVEIPILMIGLNKMYSGNKSFMLISVLLANTRTHNYGHSLLCNRIYQVATFVWSLFSKLFVDLFCCFAFVCVFHKSRWSTEVM